MTDAHQEWQTSVTDAVQDVGHVGSNGFKRVSTSTLTRTIERHRDFEGRDCLVHGPHLCRAQAAFYLGVATCLTGAACEHCKKHQIGVRASECLLEWATDIMNGVLMVHDKDLITDYEFPKLITDAHNEVTRANKMVRLLNEAVADGAQCDGETSS